MENKAAPEIWFPNLGIEIEHLDNVAFRIFGIDVYWYGIVIAIGMALALLLIFHEVKRSGQSADLYTDLSIWCIAMGIVGARLYYVVFNWQLYADNPLSMFNIRLGGLAIYGGVLGGLLAGVIFSRVKKANTWKLADTAMPGVVIGQIVGRLGNFINREVFGGYTDNLFAMRYQLSQVKAIDVTPDIANHLVNAYGTQYIQVHPTFLYESLWNVGVLVIMLILLRKKKTDGQVLAAYFIGYGVGRFWIEGIRTDQLMLWNTGIPVSQVVSVILVLVGVGILIIRHRQMKKEQDVVVEPK